MIKAALHPPTRHAVASGGVIPHARQALATKLPREPSNTDTSISQQTYPVACECGVVHQCPAGYAGSKFACKCGKTVEVPGLSQLRASVGERTLTPEVEISTLMLANALPEEDDCCLCECHTTDTLMILAICETPEAPSLAGHAARSWWMVLLLGFWGWVLMAVSLREAANANPVGRRIESRFPLRMCAECAADVSSWDVIRGAMRRTPVYRRLLQRYPDCQLSTVKQL